MLPSKTKPLISPDKISMASRSQVATACVKLFDRVQALPAHVQLLALACAFRILCETAKLRLPDVMPAVGNIMSDPLTSTGWEPRFDAMRYHIETHLLSDEVK